MKRTLFVLLSILGSLLVANAQDLITTKKGEDIEAKILEVTPKEVKYKRYSNIDGPTFTLNRNDILLVRYENGEEDVFSNEANNRSGAMGEVHEGMRYKEYKNLYDTRYYIHEAGDAYSPGWAGVASFFIPGLGQGVAGEWGRAVGFIAADIGLSALFWGSIAVLNANYEETGELTDGRGTSLLAAGALLGKVVLDIWSIPDAVHVAKVKNMYQQDIRSQRAGLDLRVEPFFAYTPTLETFGKQPTAGIALRVSF